MVLVGPAVLGRLRQDAGDHGAMELVEGRMLRGTDVARRDADLIGRLLDRRHMQQVVHEVGVRAGGPGLELGRRDDTVDARHGGRRQVAVERRHLVVAPSGRQRDRPAENHVAPDVADGGEISAGTDVRGAGAQTVLGRR